MDNRILILGGALFFVVVALGLLVVALSRASRVRRAASLEDEQSAWHADAKPPTHTVDTSLEGLELKVAPESPSAALLQPLRMGDWQPPAEPAPVAHLAPASLEHRLKGFGDPGQTTASATEVEAASATAVAPAEAPTKSEVEPPTRTQPRTPPVLPAPVKPVPSEVDHAERLANLPDVLPAPASSAPAAVPQDSPPPAMSSLELLLPEVVIPAATVLSAERMQPPATSTESAPEPVPATVATPAETPAPMAALAAIELPAPEPPAKPAPVSAQDSVPMPQRPSGSAPAASRLDELPVVAAVAPALTPEPVFPEAFEWQPPQVPAPQPVPIPAPVAPELNPPLVQEPELPVVAPPAPEPEPEPLLVPAPAPAIPVPVPVAEIASEPVPAAAQAVSVRPRAHAHAIPSAVVAPGGLADEARVAETALPQLPAGEELVMSAPVEMWFGEYRVGVKLGTKTHAQFRKYADVLLGDLKGTGGRIR